MNTVTKITNSILSSQFNTEEVKNIIEALKFKGYITNAVLPNTAQNESLAHFLERFWDFDKSPYIKEKRIAGQSIHRRYVQIMLSRAKNYWFPTLGERPIGSVCKDDIKRKLYNLATLPQKIHTRKKNSLGEYEVKQVMLSAETVNQIVRSVTCPLRWAFNNGLIQNDCFSGLVYCHVDAKERKILTMEQAEKLFSVKWEDENARMANMLAMCTGMRIGEIQALQLQDIGSDRIYVRHNYARLEGLKLPKNGEIRQIRIPKELRQLLIRQAKKNSMEYSSKNFVFSGHNKISSCQGQNWNKSLHKACIEIGISDHQNITFHSWRHFFSSYMADIVDERKLQLITGHKSKSILEHYASHESEAALLELENAAKKLFLHIITAQ